jgi:hypothetical protein
MSTEGGEDVLQSNWRTHASALIDELLARAEAAETRAVRLVRKLIRMQVDRDNERVKGGHAQAERDARRAAVAALRTLCEGARATAEECTPEGEATKDGTVWESEIRAALDTTAPKGDPPTEQRVEEQDHDPKYHFADDGACQCSCSRCTDRVNNGCICPDCNVAACELHTIGDLS